VNPACLRALPPRPVQWSTVSPEGVSSRRVHEKAMALDPATRANASGLAAPIFSNAGAEHHPPEGGDGERDAVRRARASTLRPLRGGARTEPLDGHLHSLRGMYWKRPKSTSHAIQLNAGYATAPLVFSRHSRHVREVNLAI